jgi:hypothetical protein
MNHTHAHVIEESHVDGNVVLRQRGIRVRDYRNRLVCILIEIGAVVRQADGCLSPVIPRRRFKELGQLSHEGSLRRAW